MEDNLTTDKWGLGPTGVILKVEGPWTVGVLGNHIWSIAGDSDREHVNLSFGQPFVNYTLESATVFEITTETEYDWRSEERSVPIVATVNQLIEVGGQPFYIGAGPRYWADSAPGDPEGWGVNIQFILVFPREG